MKKLTPFIVGILVICATMFVSVAQATTYQVKNYKDFAAVRDKNNNGKLLLKGAYKKYIFNFSQLKKVDIPYYPNPCYIEVYEKYIYHANIIDGKLENIGVADFMMRDYEYYLECYRYSYSEKEYEWGDGNYAEIIFHVTCGEDIVSEEEINSVLKLTYYPNNTPVMYEKLGDISVSEESEKEPLDYENTMLDLEKKQLEERLEKLREKINYKELASPEEEKSAPKFGL